MNGTKAKEPNTDDFELIPPLDNTKPDIGPVKGTVYSVMPHCVYIKFSNEGVEQVAMMVPGRMYVNGSRNLLTICKNKQMLRMLLREGMEVDMQVHELTSKKEIHFCKQGEDMLAFSKETKVEAEKRIFKAQTVKELRSVAYLVSFLFVGDKPRLQDLSAQKDYRNMVKFSKHDASIEARTKQILQCLFESEGAALAASSEEHWFLVSGETVVSGGMEGGVTGVDVPTVWPEASKQINGVVRQLHRPSGGVVEVGKGAQGLVSFARNVVRIDGFKLGHSDTLEDAVKVGDKVTVDLVNNRKEDGSLLIPSSKSPWVAGAVHKGSRGEKVVQHPEAGCIGSVAHKVRIFELYANEEGAITSGLATIQHSGIIKSGAAATSMIGEYCKFKVEDLFFYGLCLGGVDLSYLMGLGEKLMGVGEEFQCQLQMLDTKEDRAQYKVKVGWIGKTAATNELRPELTAVHNWLHRLACDFTFLEKVLLRRVPPKCALVPEGMAVGTIHSLDPAENNETVSKGLIKVECGPLKGRLIKFNRNKCSLFGMSLEKADLLYVFKQNDLVFCDVAGIGDYPEGQYVSQSISLHRLTECEKDTDPVNMNEDDSGDLLLWMHYHNLTFKELKKVLSGDSAQRYFIPFPRDPLPGRVISFDPVRALKYGCTSGTIILDGGYYNVENPAPGEPAVRDMKDVKVTFHRSAFWVYGRKMAKADLSYVVQPNQRVTVEVRQITAEDREAHKSLPADIDYRATIIWIGPSRPRNDRDDPSRNDTGIFDWLGKRGMNIKLFTNLIEGTMPAHGPHELDHNNFFLPPAPGTPMSDLMQNPISMTGPSPEHLPVLRHGPMIARILDTALSSSGPGDPRLYTLLENDEMAQGAHHVSQALQYAIQYYKEAAMSDSYGGGGGFGRGGVRGRGGFGSGYGPGGPPGRGGGKRPFESGVDYTTFGGGYSRPPQKRGNFGRGRGGF